MGIEIKGPKVFFLSPSGNIAHALSALTAWFDIAITHPAISSSNGSEPPPLSAVGLYRRPHPGAL